MDPRVWGPGAWKLIHCVTLTYPEKPTFEHKQNYRKFIYSLCDVLPCSTCAHNLREFLNENFSESILNSRTSFFQFMVDCHNAVNLSNKKPILSYVEALRANTSQPSRARTYTEYIGTALLLIWATTATGILITTYARR